MRSGPSLEIVKTEPPEFVAGQDVGSKSRVWGRSSLEEEVALTDRGGKTVGGAGVGAGAGFALRQVECEIYLELHVEM